MQSQPSPTTLPAPSSPSHSTTASSFTTASTVPASSSKFLAYLEQRRSLTQSQAAGIARLLRQPPSNAELSSHNPPTPSLPSPTASMRSMSPTPSTSSLLSSSSSFPPSKPSSPQSPPLPSSSASPSAPPLAMPSPQQSSSLRPPLFLPPPAEDEERKETVLLRSQSITASIPAPASSPASALSFTSGPLPSPGAPSLLQREMSSLHLRLRSSEEERVSERHRLERALQTAQAEVAALRKEREAEDADRAEGERRRERVEREQAEWRSEREQMQREMDRMTTFMSQVVQSSSPSHSAAVAATALSHVANVREVADNRRLKAKANKLIDEVNSKQMQLARHVRETDALREQLNDAQQRLAEKDAALREMERLRRDNVRMKAFETDAVQRELEMKEVKRARAFYAQKEEQLTRLKGEAEQLGTANSALRAEVQAMRQRMAVLEADNPRLQEALEKEIEQRREQVDALDKRVVEAERAREAAESAAKAEAEKRRSLQREVERLMKDKTGVDASGLKRDLQWLEQHSERRAMEAQVKRLQAELACLQALQPRPPQPRPAESTPLTASGRGRVAAELRRFKQAGTAALASAVDSIDAALPSPTAESATVRPAPNVTAVKKRRRRRVATEGGEGGSGPSSVPSASTIQRSPPRSSPRRRASLPSTSPSHSRPSALSAPIKPSLKGPLKAVHPLAQTSVPPALSSTPSRSASQSPLTSSGGSLRVRFATPLSVGPEPLSAGSRGSPRGRQSGGGQEAPDTPTSASAAFRFKDAFLHFF